MSEDIRSDAAKYYDLNPYPPEDLPFYRSRIRDEAVRVLELGCGTGRITLPLSQTCETIRGIDRSEAMIAICRMKLADEGIPSSKARVDLGDICQLNLEEKFDLIIAPFRVFQNLEMDDQVKGLFDSVRRHLAPGGCCILNVFRPNRDRESLIDEWCNDAETLNWEVETEDGKVTCHDRRPRLDRENLILYPELIYRKYEDGSLVDEAVLKIAMRCYYPDEL